MKKRVGAVMQVSNNSSTTDGLNPSKNESVKRNIQSTKDGDGHGRSFDITTPKNKVENWLKSQLGVQGSCTQFVEAYLAEKRQSRSLAEKKFKWDVSIFVVYSLFLVLYSFSACGTNMKGKFQARNLLEAEIGNFENVKHIGRRSSHLVRFCKIFILGYVFAADVYGFLETVIIPVVTEGGAAVPYSPKPVSVGLTPALCSGTLTTSGNIMMTPVHAVYRREAYYERSSHSILYSSYSEMIMSKRTTAHGTATKPRSTAPQKNPSKRRLTP
jgi:hypothetical protein